MSDDLDDLRAALKAATPRPDPAVKAAHLRAAEEIFDRHQESAKPKRLTSDSRPAVGWFAKGMDAMIRKLTPMKATLAATTALVAVGVVVLVPETRSLLTPPQSGLNAPVDEKPIVVGDNRRQDDPVASDDQDALGRERLAEEVAKPPVAAKKDEAKTKPADKAAHDPAPRTEMAEAELAPPAPPPSVADGVLGGIAAAPADGGGRSVAPGEGYAGVVAPAPISPPDQMTAPEPDTEAYANEAPNPVKVVLEEPVSTFSIDVDTAAWGVVRSSLMGGYLPPSDAIRVEEMVNYFPYAYPAPEGEHPFQPTVSVMPTPWNPGTQLVHIALQGEMPALEDRPPLNLVFLIDTSGSMNNADKLPLLIQSFKLMLNELRPEDEVAIVTYAGSAGQVLAPTKASDKATIIAALSRLQAGGSTAGQAGLEQAYAVAESMTEDGEVSRILLATDGDFNVGVSDVDGLEAYIAKKRESGTYLSVLGFGRGNLDDATMQALAQNGNGTASYIDTLNEARKVLVDELTGALFPIADDVKIQVEWNPAAVAEYRLIGYETRGLRREDFNNDKVDAGEIGAGVQVTAIYEITPVGSPAILNDPLRYQPEAVAAAGDAEELGFLRLRYKLPGNDASTLIETPIPVAAAEGGDEQRFAVAIAGFGQLLRGSDYLGGWTYADAIALANGAKGADDFGYRAEAVSLMRLAESLSGN